MATIELEKLTKIYSDGTCAVEQLDLDIEDGEFVVFVGPSGCGKTTALRMIAGLETITTGTVRVGGRAVNHVSPKARDMAMIFQNYALYPHMTVHDNMAFGLKMRHTHKTEIERRVANAARFLGLSEMLDKRPRQLSGGQRQRVAMGRAIVREPQAFLMDEPLSNLDAKLRVQMRAEIARIQRDLGVTAIYVTHDQSEAMTLGDRVCVLRGGVLQQVDRPQVLYDRPANVFVAGFIGSPAMNLVKAELVEATDGFKVCFGQHELPLARDVVGEQPLRQYVGRSIAIGIRPEDFEDARLGAKGNAILKVAVSIREDMGSEVFLHFAVDASPVQTEALIDAFDGDETAVASTWAGEGGTHLIARVERGTLAREGEELELSVRTDRIHFFDLESGERISSRPGGQMPVGAHLAQSGAPSG